MVRVVRRVEEAPMDPTYPLIPIICILGALCNVNTIIIVVLHMRKNLGVLMLCVWLTLFCFPRGISAIAWSDTAANKAPTWCDIGTSITFKCSVHYSENRDRSSP